MRPKTKSMASKFQNFPALYSFQETVMRLKKLDILLMIAVFLYAFTNYLASIILQEQRQCCLVETDMSLE